MPCKGCSGTRCPMCVNPKRKRAWPFYVFTIAMTTLLWTIVAAFGHSWYPPECCHDQDCAPVISYSYVASDPGKLPVMIVTTKFGTMAVPDHVTRRRSEDGQMHACIRHVGEIYYMLCFFVPDGM